jgi:hypothetical protein
MWYIYWKNRSTISIIADIFFFGQEKVQRKQYQSQPERNEFRELTSQEGKSICLRDSATVDTKLALGTLSAGSASSGAAGASFFVRRSSGWKGIGLNTIPCNSNIDSARG